MTKEQQQREAMPDAAQEPKNIVLNSSDELFADLRDKNIDAVNALVCKKLKLLSAQFDVSNHFANLLLHSQTIIVELGGWGMNSRQII